MAKLAWAILFTLILNGCTTKNSVDVLNIGRPHTTIEGIYNDSSFNQGPARSLASIIWWREESISNNPITTVEIKIVSDDELLVRARVDSVVVREKKLRRKSDFKFTNGHRAIKLYRSYRWAGSVSGEPIVGPWFGGYEISVEGDQLRAYEHKRFIGLVFMIFPWTYSEENTVWFMRLTPIVP